MAKVAMIVGAGSIKERDFISISDLELWCKEHYTSLYSKSISYFDAPFNEALILLDEVKVSNIKTKETMVLMPGQLVAKLDSQIGELPFIEPYFLHLLENNINNLLPLNNTSMYSDLTRITQEDSSSLKVVPYTNIRDVTPALLVSGDICLEILALFKTVVYMSPLISGAGLSVTINFEKLKDSFVSMEIENFDLSRLDFKEHYYDHRILYSYGRAIMTESQVLARLSKEIAKFKPP